MKTLLHTTLFVVGLLGHLFSGGTVDPGVDHLQVSPNNQIAVQLDAAQFENAIRNGHRITFRLETALYDGGDLLLPAGTMTEARIERIVRYDRKGFRCTDSCPTVGVRLRRVRAVDAIASSTVPVPDGLILYLSKQTAAYL